MGRITAVVGVGGQTLGRSALRQYLHNGGALSIKIDDPPSFDSVLKEAVDDINIDDVSAENERRWACFCACRRGGFPNSF